MQRQKAYQTTYYNQNARDLPSLKTGGTVYVQLTPNTRNWTPGLIIERTNPRMYKVRTLNGEIYIRNRNFIRPRYIDSKQSLDTTKGNTEPVEHTPQYHRPKRMAKRPQRLIEIINYMRTDKLRPYRQS